MEDARMSIGGTLVFSDLWRWAGAFFKSPRPFFRGMEKKGGYLTPCLYAAAWLFASELAGLLVSLLRPAPAAGSGLFQAAGVLFGPFVGLFFGFLLSAVFFVVWHLMGSKEDYQTAFRVWAFMTPLSVVSAILGLVPFLSVAVVIYGFYLLIISSQEVHGLSAERSWGVWGGLGGLVFALAFVSVIAALALKGKGGFPVLPSSPFSLTGGR